MSSAILRSFAGGIVGPELAGRAEQARYQTGLKRCDNAIVQRSGGVTNRPGWRFIAATRYGTTYPVRLLKFVFNDEQTYVLEFGQNYMRVYRDGGIVVPSAAAWSNATNYVVGDIVLQGGVTYYCILAHLNQVPPNATYWSPMTAGFYEMPTPYLAADVRDIKYVQSADVVTLVHPSYPVKELRRTGHTAWTLTSKDFTPNTSRPTNAVATAGGAGAEIYRYQVTAFNTETLEESYPAFETTRTITGATQANPCVITAVAHGYQTGDEVIIEGVGGMTQLNGIKFLITRIGANTFSLDGINSTGYGAYTAGGTAKRPYARIDAAAVPSTSAPHVITWTNLGAGYGYWVYRWVNGVFQFIGEAKENAVATTVSFSDNNIGPNATLTPPIEKAFFAAAGDYPSAVNYVQQRLVLANTTNDPERIWMSQIGNFDNFANSQPVQADDGFNFQLNGSKVNSVRHLLQVGGRMVVLTQGAEWTITGRSSRAIVPGDVDPQQQGETGAADLTPVVIGSTAIYVQARGSLVRDAQYDFGSDSFQGQDLTIFCPEQFDKFTLIAWDYQQIPHSVLWAVRSDGVLLGLTYVREHEIRGWHKHYTREGDIVEDVVCVPEGNQDGVWLVVNRLVNGSRVRYIERMEPRNFDLIEEDAFFVDCGLTYDGRNTTATTLTLTGGTLWDETEELVCTASANTFAASNIGDQVALTAADDERYFAEIVSYTSPTVVGVRPLVQIPADIRAVATTAWALAVDTVTGLGHLEGCEIAGLADGNVIPVATVSGGSVAIGSPAIIAHIGLAYTTRIETLDIENLSGETLFDKHRNINQVSLLVNRTRALWLGFGDGELREHQDRDTEDYDEAIQLVTGLITENVDGGWEKTGKVVVEQRDPLPMTVLAIIPRSQVGGS